MPKIRKVSPARRQRNAAASKKRKALLDYHKLTKPPKFRDIVRNVLKISKKNGYDPATGTNWCHLPMEIRMQCINSMNFRTRACIRGTSTTEKALVESKKYEANMLFMDSEVFRMNSYSNSEFIEVSLDEERDESWQRERIRKMAAQIKLILKLCVINHIYVRYSGILEPEDFVEDFPINCNQLEFKEVSNELVLFFVKNCVPGMKSIEFDPANCLPMYQIVHAPSIYTARSVSFAFLECICYLHDLLEDDRRGSRHELLRCHPRKSIPKARRTLSGNMSDSLEQMNEEVETSGKEEKTGYDPATGTNWCHMPMEIRMMCIEEMDFKSRVFLRGTSTVEKALVESKQYLVWRLDIHRWHFVMESGKFGTEHTEDTTNVRRKTREEAQKQLTLLKLVFKLCEINSFYVNSDYMFKNVDLTVPMPIECGNLILSVIEPSFMLFLLRNCPRNMDTIDFPKIDRMPLPEIVTLPSVYTAETVRFTELDCHRFIPQLIQKWIGNRAEVDTELEYETKLRNASQMFFDHFRDRVVSRNEMDSDCLRLSTDSENEIFMTFDSYDGTHTVNCRVVEPGDF